MRMWMVDPAKLCTKHLLGEHGEIHKFRHNFEKKHSMKKRCELRQIQPAAMQTRHDELAAEMLRRGFKHASPYELPDLSYLSEEERRTTVDILAATTDLFARCPNCRSR